MYCNVLYGTVLYCGPRLTLLSNSIPESFDHIDLNRILSTARLCLPNPPRTNLPPARPCRNREDSLPLTKQSHGSGVSQLCTVLLSCNLKYHVEIPCDDVLCCAILLCTVQYSTVLYCTVLECFALTGLVLLGNVWCGTAPCSIKARPDPHRTLACLTDTVPHGTL